MSTRPWLCGLGDCELVRLPLNYCLRPPRPSFALSKLRSSRIEGSRCPENLIVLSVGIRKARLPHPLTGETQSFPYDEYKAVLARQPNYLFRVAKRRRQEKATPEMAVRCEERTRRHHRQESIAVLTSTTNVTVRVTALAASRNCMDYE
jgi:hypothetical protein